MGTGELAALAAAALWACSSLIYGRTPLSAWQINFGKNILASILLLVHLAVVAALVGRPMFSADLRTITALAISSVVGIVIGDTYYFRSLQILGPRHAGRSACGDRYFLNRASRISRRSSFSFIF